MNISAFEERERNKKHIQVCYRRGFKVVEVDTRSVEYRNKPWHALSRYLRRKFENDLFLQHSQKDMSLKFIFH